MDQIIEKAIQELDKRYGKGTVMNFSENVDNSIKRIASGSIGLDAALGGGWPKGRIIEIYGPESSGKTTLTLHAIAEVQKEGGVAAFIDAEHAFDPNYAENLGIDIHNNFLFSQPDNGEQALEVAEAFIRTNKVDLIVIDSVSALVPKAELEGEAGENKVGLQARMMSQAMRKLVGAISNANCTVIFLNQLRMKIGVMFGSPETTSGGEALKYAASIRCDVRRVGQNKDGDEILSNKTRVKVIKNKTAPPFKQCEFDIVFGQGIDIFTEIVNMAVEKDIVKKSGSWYNYGDVKLGQGIDNVKSLLIDNVELFEEISTKVRELINSK